ncbi:MAG TPA: hypothetical protein VJC12_01775 [Candidatus Paceibacterota bacterium]
MKENKLKITINSPSVFDFTTEPDNTPKWIDGIVSEAVNERPIRVGTLYTNIDKEGNKNIYKVTQFVDGEIFELKLSTSTYKVRYTYNNISLDKVELEYFEWVEEGELLNPFKQSNIEKLKTILESN